MDADTRQELTRLADSISSLELRLTALEETTVRRHAPAHPELVETETAEAGVFSGVFAKLALVCFSLVGALLLRIATQQELIDDVAGTAIGLGYCALLTIAPTLGRRLNVIATHGSVLQVAGLVLAPLIVLEMFHRRGVFDVPAATGILVATGVTGCLLGGLGSKRYLAGIGLFAAAIGVAGLGVDPSGAGARAAALIALVACGLVSAHVRAWVGVRAAILLPALAAVGLGILTTARRTELPASVPATLVLTAVALWLLVLVNHLVRRARMQSDEAAWLVVVSIWCGALIRFAFPSGPTAGVIAAAVLLALGYLLARARSGRAAAIAAAVAGGALALVSLPGLDPTGVGLGFVPLALWAINRTQSSDAFDVVGAIAVVTAAAVALPPLVSVPAAPTTVLLSGLLLPAALLIHWGAPGVETRTRPVLAPVSLVAGWALAFFAARAVSYALLGAGDRFQLAVTLELAALALASQALGKRITSKIWLAAGLAGIGVVAIKSIFWDLFHLTGPYATASVVALGVGFGLTSVLLRKSSA